VEHRELLYSTGNYRGAWMREDYRRCNLDQGAFVECRACAQQIPSATLMSVAWSAGAPPPALKKMFPRHRRGEGGECQVMDRNNQRRFHPKQLMRRTLYTRD
jgi:hypothetical protein